MPNQDLAILICSCDSYEDVWSPFFYFFHKYWADCPWPVYLMTNHKEYADPSVSTIATGEDKDWSTGFLRAVERMNSRHVLIIMEDYFLLDKPNQAFLEQAVPFMRKHRLSYLRLFPRPAPDDSLGELANTAIGRISKHADYRVSLQAAIWDTDYIKRLVRVGESAWEMEINGSQRSRSMPDRLASVANEEDTPIPYLCTAVVKGYWTKEAVRMCRQSSLQIDLKKRRKEPFYVRRNIRPIIAMVEMKNQIFARK